MSPPAGMEVLEGTAVALSATSVDPDTWSSVPDGETEWQVRRGGAEVHTATGHEATFPAGKVTPGSYTVRFTAGGVTAEASLTVTAIPPGQTKPVATITAPGPDHTAGSGGGPVEVSFTGTGTDAEDGTIAGTRYQWVAYRGAETKVLCPGSNVPHGGPPGELALPHSCASFTGTLDVVDPVTKWSVWLEVYDSTGLVGTDTITVTITLAIP